jgi:hypothetical protein
LPSKTNIVLWCKGSTTDFDSVCLGSNPGKTTTYKRKHLIANCLRFFVISNFKKAVSKFGKYFNQNFRYKVPEKKNYIGCIKKTTFAYFYFKYY